MGHAIGRGIFLVIFQETCQGILLVMTFGEALLRWKWIEVETFGVATTSVADHRDLPSKNPIGMPRQMLDHPFLQEDHLAAIWDLQ
jgi:hypothetical protein